MKPDRLANPAVAKSYFITRREEYTGNSSGIEPVGTKVLILTDSIGDQTGGGIELPPDVAERMTLAITTGVVVAIGGASFTDWPNSDRTWPGKVPEVADRVHIAKYAGVIVEGTDLKRYRLIQDTDVSGMEVGAHRKQVFSSKAMGQA